MLTPEGLKIPGSAQVQPKVLLLAECRSTDVVPDGRARRNLDIFPAGTVDENDFFHRVRGTNDDRRLRVDAVARPRVMTEVIVVVPVESEVEL